MSITKKWWVRIKSIISSADGTIYGLGSDGMVYNWHHSFEYRGQWVLHVNFTENRVTREEQ